MSRRADLLDSALVLKNLQLLHGFCVNFRRRLESTLEVLHGKRQHGFVVGWIVLDFSGFLQWSWDTVVYLMALSVVVTRNEQVFQSAPGGFGSILALMCTFSLIADFVSLTPCAHRRPV